MGVPEFIGGSSGGDLIGVPEFIRDLMGVPEFIGI